MQQAQKPYESYPQISQLNKFQQDVRKHRTPLQQFEEIHPNTLDEGILETLTRQLKSTGWKFVYVLFPCCSGEAKTKLRNWDLWGPFFLCLIYALFINNTDQFVVLLLTILVGAIVVTFNTKILGGNVSYLQSIAILGYCIFPLFIIMFILKLLKFIKYDYIGIKIIIVLVATVWSVFAARIFLSVNLPQDRKIVGLFPLIVFYLFVGVLLLFV